ncbi:type I restriction-modification system, M subunit [Flavobacterium sp. TAB 87]|nr:type I restriction-modification system, M subunit [Flavobacterium sp. TAB 87]
MGFSKKQHLQQNIDAIRIAFKLEKENRKATVGERLLMMQFSGFGGLKFVLNPVEKEIDINHWRKTDLNFFLATQVLHQLLKDNSTDDKQYRRYIDSMRSSVLTAFHTPPQVINAISETSRESGLNINKFLEPSAGIGSFIESFSKNQFVATTAYEKDLLTGKILKQLYPNNNIRVSGFEEIPEKEQKTYDLIASNIPFGDTSVFDLSYSRSKDATKVQATRSIHNYFFLKGTDMLRDGGILAFITSQGVLNSPKNEPIRRGLMQNNNLISAIRLPNNLFTEYAGTEVGSDLIILQKNTTKQDLSETEELFCQSRLTEFNTPSNALFLNTTKIIHTDEKLGTDPYGQPALVYSHKGGVEGIAKDFKQILSADFDKYLNIELYKGEQNNDHAIQITVPPAVKPSITQPVIETFSSPIQNKNSVKEERQLNIFDLFDNTQQELVAVDTIAKTSQTKKRSITGKRTANGIQTNLFSNFNQHPFASSVQSNRNKETSKTKQIFIGDLFSQISGISSPEIQPIVATIPEPAIYKGAIKSFHRNECLIIDNGWVGYLKDFDKDSRKAIFHPLQLSASQKGRTQAYIEVRDIYLDLYQNETEKHTEHKPERETLNNLYDAFVKKYGNLNSADNIKLIKTDSAGKEIPYLERVVGGVVHKADISHRPVSFSTATLATENPDEALSASLNKYGNVHLDYMSEISGITSDTLKESLQDRIYYNPLKK